MVILAGLAFRPTFPRSSRADRPRRSRSRRGPWLFFMVAALAGLADPHPDWHLRPQGRCPKSVPDCGRLGRGLIVTSDRPPALHVS